MEYRIITQELTKKIGNRYAVNGLSAKFGSGCITAVIGPEGSGKTTLLGLLGGVLHPDGGLISYLKQDGKNPKIGLLLGDSGLYERMTALENMKIKALQLGMKGESEIRELLFSVGLEKWADRKVKEFSPGMKKRLLIALAVLGYPEILLLDEPMRGLDQTGVRDVRTILTNLKKEKNMTVILTADTVLEVSGLTDERIFLLDGKISDGGGSAASYFGSTPNYGASSESFGAGDVSADAGAYLILRAEPLPKAREVLDSMGIFGYQTRSADTLHILEQAERKEEILSGLSENGVAVKECRVVYDAPEIFRNR